MSRARKSDFLKNVQHELEMIKKHATKDEISKLSIDLLNPTSSSECIYGQLTGSCENNRAKELMDVSCIQIVHGIKNGRALGLIQGSGLFGTSHKRTSETFTDIRDHVNGAYEGQMWDCDGDRDYSSYTALEVYILLRDAKKEEVIAFLKDEIQDIKL